jgi:hypothetical protein
MHLEHVLLFSVTRCLLPSGCLQILCHLFNFKILQTSSIQEKLSGMEGKPAAELLRVTVLLFLYCRLVSMLCPGMVVFCTNIMTYSMYVCIKSGPQKPALAPRPLKIYLTYSSSNLRQNKLELRKINARFQALIVMTTSGNTVQIEKAPFSEGTHCFHLQGWRGHLNKKPAETDSKPSSA